MGKISFLIIILALLGGWVGAQGISTPNDGAATARRVCEKSALERRFWGNSNALSEYFFSPSPEMNESAAGLRIIKDPSRDSQYVIQIKYITNWRDVSEKLAKKYPVQGLSLAEMGSMSKEEKDLVAKRNMEAYSRQEAESVGLYDIKTVSFTTSTLGDKLNRAIVDLIRNYNPNESPELLVDGYFATFRCLVDNKERSLVIHQPQGHALQVSNLCRQIITDAQANRFDAHK